MAIGAFCEKMQRDDARAIAEIKFAERSRIKKLKAAREAIRARYITGRPPRYWVPPAEMLMELRAASLRILGPNFSAPASLKKPQARVEVICNRAARKFRVSSRTAKSCWDEYRSARAAEDFPAPVEHGIDFVNQMYEGLLRHGAFERDVEPVGSADCEAEDALLADLELDPPLEVSGALRVRVVEKDAAFVEEANALILLARQAGLLSENGDTARISEVSLSRLCHLAERADDVIVLAREIGLIPAGATDDVILESEFRPATDEDLGRLIASLAARQPGPDQA